MRPTIARVTRRALSLLGEPHGPGAGHQADHPSPAVRFATVKPVIPKSATSKPAVSPNVRDEIRRRAIKVADAWANDAARRD